MAEVKQEAQADDAKMNDIQKDDEQSDKLLIVISGITSGIGVVE